MNHIKLTLLALFLVESVTGQSLIAHYNFEGNADDVSGNGHHAQIIGEHYFDNTHIGTALRIVGNSQIHSNEGGHVRLPDLNLGTYNEFSISLWIKEIEMLHDHGEAYISFGNTTYTNHPENQSVQIGHYNLSNEIVQYNVGASPDYGGGALSIPDDSVSQFNHYVLTYSQEKDSLTAYFNGQHVGSTPATLDSLYSFAAIGSHFWNNQSTRLHAVIDEVKIYSSLLSSDEVQALFAEPNNTTSVLLGHWPLDGHALDYSTFANHGVIHGAHPTQNRHGHDSTAMQFNPTSGFSGSHIVVPHSEVIAPENAITVAAWVKLDAFENTGIICKRINELSQPYNSYYLSPGSSMNGFTFGITTTQGSAGVKGDENIELNKWYHVAASYDGLLLKLFIDGEEVDAKPHSGPIIYNTNSLRFGKAGSHNYTFVGALDEVRIYDYALSLNEIITLAESKSLKKPLFTLLGDSAYIKDNLRATLFLNDFDTSKNYIAYQFKFHVPDGLKFKDAILPVPYTENGVVEYHEDTDSVSIGYISSTRFHSPGQILTLSFESDSLGHFPLSLSDFYLNTEEISIRDSADMHVYGEPGDVDINKVVQAYDAAITFQYSLGLQVVTTDIPPVWENWRVQLGDMNSDMAITTYDALLILLKSLGISPNNHRKGHNLIMPKVNVENNTIHLIANEVLHSFQVSLKSQQLNFEKPNIPTLNGFSDYKVDENQMVAGLITEVGIKDTLISIPFTGQKDDKITLEVLIHDQKHTIEIDILANGKVLKNAPTRPVLYPNPASDYIHLNSIQSFELFNLSGKKVLEGTAADIDVRPLKAGIYLIKIGSISRKIVIN